MKISTAFKKAMLAGAMVLISAGIAQAKTNVIVTNVTGGDIIVGNKSIGNKKYQWTELKALVTLPDGNRIEITDPSSKCDGGWSILAAGGGILPAVTCVDIPFGQIGCVAAYVKKSTTPGIPYKVEMTGVSGSFCLDGWWNSGGSAILDRAADEVERFSDKAIDGLKAVVELKKGK